MDYVYLVQATEEQYKKIMNLLDVALKKDGLDAIQDVVDVYNCLVSANKVSVPQTQATQTEQKQETTPELPG